MKIKGTWSVLHAARIAHALSECNDAWVDVCIVHVEGKVPEVVIVIGETLVPPGYWRSVTFYEGHQV